MDVIVGNPPFLGSQRMRGELGDSYVDTLRKLYEGRVPGSADLVCYWHEKARAHIAAGKARRAGLLATNSIRGGANREVLKRIKDSGDIFMAWSDRDWVLDGAAVRVSMVGFDNGNEKYHVLDGTPVFTINSDLTFSIDITTAATLDENKQLAFQGPVKVGPFDIADKIALPMLKAEPQNRNIIKPYMNGEDIVNQNRGYWLIDFGVLSETEASQYLLPFKYVEENVKPERLKNNDRQRRENWWRLGRTGDDYKQAKSDLERQIFTPRVAKHRIFIWVETQVMPSDALVAIARDDDYFFGVLHSHLHEVWSLRMGTWLGVGNDPRYTPTTTFETFPFPWPPGQEQVDSLAYQAVSAAARQLHEERSAWLKGDPLPTSPVHGGGVNAPADSAPLPVFGEGLGVGSDSLSMYTERGLGGEVSGTERGLGGEVADSPPRTRGGAGGGVKDRTLTNLYNALNVLRGKEDIRVKPDAAAFAPRLDQLHVALDQAVCAAYGWSPDILNDDEEILRRLLELNLQRAAGRE